MNIQIKKSPLEIHDILYINQEREGYFVRPFAEGNSNYIFRYYGDPGADLDTGVDNPDELMNWAGQWVATRCISRRIQGGNCKRLPGV